MVQGNKNTVSSFQFAAVHGAPHIPSRGLHVSKLSKTLHQNFNNHTRPTKVKSNNTISIKVGPSSSTASDNSVESLLSFSSILTTRFHHIQAKQSCISQNSSSQTQHSIQAVNASVPIQYNQPLSKFPHSTAKNIRPTNAIHVNSNSRSQRSIHAVNDENDNHSTTSIDSQPIHQSKSDTTQSLVEGLNRTTDHFNAGNPCRQYQSPFSKNPFPQKLNHQRGYPNGKTGRKLPSDRRCGPLSSLRARLLLLGVVLLAIVIAAIVAGVVVSLKNSTAATSTTITTITTSTATMSTTTTATTVTTTVTTITTATSATTPTTITTATTATTQTTAVTTVTTQTTQTTTATTATTQTTTTTTTITTTTPTCFYGKDMINLVEGGQRAIEQLKVGDRIWSLTRDGKSMIQDEILLMADNGPNKTALFYTFKTEQDYEVSLTDNHNIPVYIPETNEIEYLRASKVTLKHYLIMHHRKIEIKSITINSRIGYYSPLTLSSFLFVNNISTSVFADSYRLSPDHLHHIFTPIRVYYYSMRWIFGKNYDPFPSDIKEGLHPLLAWMKYHQNKIRNFYLSLIYALPTLFFVFILHLAQKIFLKSLNK